MREPGPAGSHRIGAFVIVGALIGLGSFVVVPQGAQAACIPPPSGLVAWWTGDGHPFDIIGGNDGTLQNGATFAAGKVGLAFSFDGVDDSVLVSNPIPVLAGSRTIDAWVRTTSTARQTVYDDQDANADGGWPLFALHILSTGEARFIFRDDFAEGADGIFLDSIRTVNDGNFHHVAGVWDAFNDLAQLYIDGVLDVEVPGLAAIGTISNYGLPSIGIHTAGPPPTPFAGLIDEVEIYDRSLSADEIAAMFQAGSDGKCKFITVGIDIKPGSDPNSINLNSGGTVPVAILSTVDFDATTVDPTTVALADANVKIRGKGTPMASFEDVNGDGLLDLVVHVETKELQLTETDTEATVEGSTFDGTPIRGTDSVRIVPPES